MSSYEVEKEVMLVKGPNICLQTLEAIVSEHAGIDDPDHQVIATKAYLLWLRIELRNCILLC
jgi:hypothetical protein